jgi:sulfite reductase (NADPH) flavoprotein alpha-component
MIYNRDNPFLAKLKSRTRINGLDSDKNVQHLVLDIAGSGLTYKCGDSIGVLPKNDMAEVKNILGLLKIQPDMEVKLPFIEKKIPILTALYEKLCITSLSKHFFEWFSIFITDTDEASYVKNQILGDAQECKTLPKAYSLLDVLDKFRSYQDLNINELATKLPRLMPRLYSIASSPLVSRDEIHIVVNVVSYTSVGGSVRHGVASTYLANGLNIGENIGMFLVNSTFALPPDATANMIMIGPGTGIAPFRGFLQEKQVLKNRGEEIGNSWLFFGDRHYATDFLFKEELLEFKNSGVMTNLDLAFSRDQEQKVYVQDKIWENRQKLWSWISNGAYIYLCGNASSMAVDVDNTLKRIAIEMGNFDEDHANKFFQSLKESKRYQKDVY